MLDQSVNFGRKFQFGPKLLSTFNHNRLHPRSLIFNHNKPITALREFLHDEGARVGFTRDHNKKYHFRKGILTSEKIEPLKHKF